MEKHPKLTEGRIIKFQARIWGEIYEEALPLKAVYTRDKAPIPVTEINKRKYNSIAPGTYWGGEWDSAWFKLSGSVPSGWKGSEVMAFLDFGGEAAVFSKDGTPLAGLTSLTGNTGMAWAANMQRHIKKALYPVVKNASGREKVGLLVEAAANYLFGRQQKTIFRRASLVKFNRAKWELYHDYFFLADLARSLPEHSTRRSRLLFALNEIINMYFTGSEAEVKKCRELAKKEIQNGANTSAPLVSAIGHSHIDTAWMWPLRETRRKVGRTFSTVIKLMEEYPDYKFGASQAQLYQFCKENYPELYEKIKKAVKAKRWELQGGMWVEADCNLISGESLVRQFLHGKRFFKKEFGVEVDNLWLPDVFGYAAALPQILKKSGVNYFLTQKLSWSQFNKFPHHSFYWEGIDGTDIFTHFPPANNYNSIYEPAELIFAQKEFLEKDRAKRFIYLFGFGDGGGGPSRHMLEFAKRAKNCEELPRVEQEFAKDFFPKCEKDIKGALKWKGELYLEFHRGTYTTHARNKKGNRKAELLLRDAELLRALEIKNYPAAELDRLWKLVLLNQFHDIIPGSSIPLVYEDSLKQYSDIMKSGASLAAGGLSSLAKKIDTTGEGKPVVLFNSLSWAREEMVRLHGVKGQLSDNSGNTLPCQETKDGLLAKVSIPPLGYTVCHISGKMEKAETTLKVKNNLLENSLLRVEFGKGGQISSIYDKEKGREAVKDGGFFNLFKVYDEKGEDAWDTHIYHEEQQYTAPELKKTEITEAGPLRASIRQTWQVSKTSSIIQEIRLAEGGRKLEFVTKLEWHEEERLLKVFFETSVNSSKANYDIQFGYVERPAMRNTSWDMAKFEVCAQKWADYSEASYGISLLNDCKYGHGVKDGVMSLTLLRSPLHPDPMQTVNAMPNASPYPVTDQGSHEFTYVIYPHAGGFIEARTVQAGYELNSPVRVFVPASGKKGTLPKEHSFFSLDKDFAILDTVKKSEDGKDIILRLYEALGMGGEVSLSIAKEINFKKALLVNLMEEKEKELKVENGTIKLILRPFDIITIKLV